MYYLRALDNSFRTNLLTLQYDQNWGCYGDAGLCRSGLSLACNSRARREFECGNVAFRTDARASCASFPLTSLSPLDSPPARQHRCRPCRRRSRSTKGY